MKSSWLLARIAGIGIYVHWTFLLLVALVVYVHVRAGQGIGGALEALGFIAAVFACIVLHELGHALTARRFGIPTRDITLLPIGGVARLERMPEDPREELLIALGGPAVTLAIAAALFGLVVALEGIAAVETPREVMGTTFLVRLMWVNAFLLAFNLLPAFPMDGGRVLRAALHFRLDYVRATEIAAALGQVMAVLFGIAAMIGPNLILLVIAVFVYLTAREETRAARVRSLCEDVPVSYAMVTRFRELPAAATLGDAVDELLAGAQQDFPVTEDGAVVGVLTRDDLLRALATRGRDAPVVEVMRRDCPAVDERESLQSTFDRMRSGNCSTLPVVRDGRPVGLVTLENVGEWMMIQSVLRRSRPRADVQDLFRLG